MPLEAQSAGLLFDSTYLRLACGKLDWISETLFAINVFHVERCCLIHANVIIETDQQYIGTSDIFNVYLTNKIRHERITAAHNSSLGKLSVLIDATLVLLSSNVV